jgi:hypothetical protein
MLNESENVMIKFGSIGQFKNVIKAVRDTANWNKQPIPTLQFIGTTKIHGTNASVVFDHEGNHVFQSRERVLSIESDNAGFCMWGERNIQELKKTYDALPSYFKTTNPGEHVAIFGEWCGSTIQKGVGVSKLPHKMFVIFNITFIGNDGVPATEETPEKPATRIELPHTEIQAYVHRTNEIHSIYDFPTWVMDIDFNAPQLVQNKLVDLTLAVEEECPVAKHFGISGVGEGIVWWNYDQNLTFKVKGEKHSVSKVKTIKEIAAVDIERMASLDAFIDTVITENRLNQGLAKLSEMGLDIDVKNTGTYIKWVVNDAMKEEQDVIVASNFDMKELGGKMSNKAKVFWFDKLKEV